MTQTKIEAGKWYRHRHHGPVKVLTGEVYSIELEQVVDCVGADGKDRCSMYVDWLEPWTPRVGEWVQWTGPNVTAACRTPWCVHTIKGGWVMGETADGTCCDDDMSGDPPLEPCSPPTTQKAPVRNDLFKASIAEAAARYGGSITEALRSTYARRIDERKALYAAHRERYPHTCTRCGSPAYHGITSEERSQGTECGRELEPASVDNGYLQGGTFIVVPQSKTIPKGLERLWRARGAGTCADHPTREGAIMAWREAVKR